MADHLAADGFTDGDDHAGAAQTDQPWSADTDAPGVIMPLAVPPWGQVVDCENGGNAGKVRDLKIGPMEKFSVILREGPADSPKPPAAFRRADWCAATAEVT